MYIYDLQKTHYLKTKLFIIKNYYYYRRFIRFVKSINTVE